MKKESERDYRLDFCRGLALILIFIDHVKLRARRHRHVVPIAQAFGHVAADESSRTFPRPPVGIQL